jgi:uncharacterized protein
MAESAVRCGSDVVAVDFFGDRDQARAAESYALGRDLGLPLTASGLGRAARRFDVDAVAYTANVENHPSVLRAFVSRGLTVLGNDERALRDVRDWRMLREFCRDAGIRHPETLLAGEESLARPGVRWLRKRVRSGGGHGVRRWRGGRLDDAHLLQAEVEGRVASASFVADGRSARVFALTEQLVGDRRLGARRRAWCGNILPLEPQGPTAERLLAEVARMASLLAGRFRLHGVNGLDLIVRREPDGELAAHLIEVNPRYTASMELAEDAGGGSVFAMHAAGVEGRLPAEKELTALPSRYVGKAVLFTRRDVVAPDTDLWLERGVRDVPQAGAPVRAGHPVCTVVALGAPDRTTCREALHQEAATIEKTLHPRRDTKGDTP